MNGDHPLTINDDEFERIIILLRDIRQNPCTLSFTTVNSIYDAVATLGKDAHCRWNEWHARQEKNRQEAKELFLREMGDLEQQRKRLTELLEIEEHGNGSTGSMS